MLISKYVEYLSVRNLFMIPRAECSATAKRMANPAEAEGVEERMFFHTFDRKRLGKPAEADDAEEGGLPRLLTTMTPAANEGSSPNAETDLGGQKFSGRLPATAPYLGRYL